MYEVAFNEFVPSLPSGATTLPEPVTTKGNTSISPTYPSKPTSSLAQARSDDELPDFSEALPEDEVRIESKGISANVVP